MPGLKIAKSNRNSQLPPSGIAVNKALEVAKTPESIDYLDVRFGETMDSLGGSVQKASLGMHNKIKARKELIHLEREANGAPWSAIPPDTDFINRQKKIAKKSSAELREEIGAPITVDVAINNASQFMRRFSTKGKALGTEQDSQMDQLLNTFWGMNNMVSKNSTLYETTAEGVVKREGGQPKKADPRKAEQLLADKENGFDAFLEKRGVHVEAMNTHKYPEEAAAAQAQASAKGEPATPEKPARPETETPVAPTRPGM